MLIIVYINNNYLNWWYQHFELSTSLDLITDMNKLNWYLHCFCGMVSSVYTNDTRTTESRRNVDTTINVNGYSSLLSPLSFYGNYDVLLLSGLLFEKNKHAIDKVRENANRHVNITVPILGNCVIDYQQCDVSLYSILFGNKYSFHLGVLAYILNNFASCVGQCDINMEIKCFRSVS